MIQFDKPFTFVSTVFENNILPNETEAKGNHTGAVIGFATKKGEIVHARVASSFISPEQAELNLKELGKNSFDQLVANGREIWNREMSKIEIEDLQRRSASRLYVYRHRILGHVPLPVPFPQPDVSVNESKDAGGTSKYLQGKRFPAGMGQPGTSGLYGRQQLGFRSGRRLHQRIARI